MDYQNFTFRYIDVGLDLRDAPDKVKEGRWIRLKNVTSSQEALLTTRPGRTLLFDTGLDEDVHTIKRLSSETHLVGVGDRVYRNSNPYPSTGWSGEPLNLVIFQPGNSSSIWAYVADAGQMRKFNADGSDFRWGISAPVAPANAVANPGSGNLNSSAANGVDYDWRYTYRNSITGAESNPSPITVLIPVVNQSANVSVTASPDPQVDQIRLYRRGGGNDQGRSKWRFVTETANVSGVITDNNSNSSIALALEMPDDNYVPFTSVDPVGNTLYEVPLPYVWGPFIGKYIFAAGDPNRPGDLYWTNAERPDSADTKNHVRVTPPNEPLIGGLIYNGVPYAFTHTNSFAIDFGGALALPTFSSRKMPVGRGVVGPFAFCAGPMIYMVASDGIYETTGQTPAKSITEEHIRPIFRGLSVGGLAPVDFTHPEEIRLTYGEPTLHFYYLGQDGVKYHLVSNILYGRWSQESTTGFTEQISYLDENQSSPLVLVGGDNGKIYTVSGTTDDGELIDVNVRTGSLDMEQPQTLKEYGNVIVDTDAQNVVISVTPLLNAESTSLPTQTVSGAGRQKVPLNLLDTYAYSIAFDYAWSGVATIYQKELLWRGEEEEIKHWEFPDTTHGQSGWQHVRDIYICWRSSTPGTLTITVDGEARSYPVPSTGGEKRKVLIHLNPLKGKVFRYALNSSGSFRLYGNECEVRAKTWNTALGYQLFSPFGNG